MVLFFLIKFLCQVAFFFTNVLTVPQPTQATINGWVGLHITLAYLLILFVCGSLVYPYWAASVLWLIYVMYWQLPWAITLVLIAVPSRVFLFLHNRFWVPGLILLLVLLPKGSHNQNLFFVVSPLVVAPLSGFLSLGYNPLPALLLASLVLIGVYLLYNFNFFYLLSFRSFLFNFLERWVFTTNHKRVGVNYMWYVVLAGVVATAFATAIKLELGEPGSLYCGGNMRLYLSLVTGHAVVMVFLTYVPVYYGVFTNYLIPIQLGARDFAYPRLNNFSFWVFPPSLFFFTSALLKYQGLLTG